MLESTSLFIAEVHFVNKVKYDENMATKKMVNGLANFFYLIVISRNSNVSRLKIV